MSRIGKKPIVVPEDVEVTINGNHIVVKGPKGSLERELNKSVKIEKVENTLILTNLDSSKDNLYGLNRTLVANMVQGVHEEFKKELQINGVGYKAVKQGNKLVLSLGYSHPVEMEQPDGITFDVPSPNQIIVRGISKELVGQIAANIREKRPPEVYRGKGIKYSDEVIRRKEGKAGKSA